MPNIKFSFLYRDAANYKTWGEVVFANPENLSAKDIRQTILNSCNPDGGFDPRPWGLPNIRTQPYDPELDHDYYEFESVEESEEYATEARSLAAFLDVVKANPLKSPF